MLSGVSPQSRGILSRPPVMDRGLARFLAVSPKTTHLSTIPPFDFCCLTLTLIHTGLVYVLSSVIITTKVKVKNEATAVFETCSVFFVVVAQSQVSVGQKAKNLNYKYVVVLREKR